MIYAESEFLRFTADSQRIAANLEQAYYAWLEVVRQLREMPSTMHWVARGDSAYLSVKMYSNDSGTTIGKRGPSTEKMLAEYQRGKSVLKERVATLDTLVSERASLYRRLRFLPTIPDRQAEILREIDISGKLSNDLMVVGTNAFSAYELACGARFPAGNEETEDFDLTWCRPASSSPSEHPRKTLFGILRSIDSTYRINPKKPYRATNSTGYEVELLAAPSRHPFPSEEIFSPMATLIEQEWLLNGSPIGNVIATIRNRACPLYVPDPRWMALHRLWLSEKPERNPLKREKDARQGNVLLDAVRYFLPHSHPLNNDFVLGLPGDLLPYFNEWAKGRDFIPENPAQFDSL